jgi:hypothetical protein
MIEMSKRLIFELSMPASNAWNGEWSGANNKYTIAKRLTNKSAAALKDYYTYSFGDGWVAGITIRPAKPREKATGKFCGYDWMIDSILRHVEIKANF